MVKGVLTTVGARHFGECNLCAVNQDVVDIRIGHHRLACRALQSLLRLSFLCLAFCYWGHARSPLLLLYGLSRLDSDSVEFYGPQPNRGALIWRVFKGFIAINLRLAEQLKWLAESPDLIKCPDLALPAGLFTASKPTLESTDISARRLGLQFEQLVKLSLRLNSEVTDLKSNIPIRDGKITVGEADLLFRHRSVWWHLELALKFYLREMQTEGLGGYYGPNRRDRFDLKWQHMLKHQCTIFSHPAAQSIRDELGIERLNRAVLIKGWVFQHPNDPRKAEPDPIDPMHAGGWWVRQCELEAWLSSQLTSARYLVVQKPYWLYPVARVKSRALSKRQLIDQLAKPHSAVQVWVVLGEGYSRQLVSRGYVVPDNWGSDDR
jgi:hypothetical protein